jgi:hypothetical protein
VEIASSKSAPGLGQEIDQKEMGLLHPEDDVNAGSSDDQNSGALSTLLCPGPAACVWQKEELMKGLFQQAFSDRV